MINESYLGFGFVHTVSLAHKLLSNFIPSEEQLLGQWSVYAITLSSKRHLEETLDFSESEIAKILATRAVPSYLFSELEKSVLQHVTFSVL